MKIGIISDVHDNITNLRISLAKLAETDALLCCGDLCSPFIMKELGEGYPQPIHVVFGNNDGDHYRLTTTANKYDQITLHGELAELEFEGQKFAMNHFDNIGRLLAASKKFDVVCFGHNHTFELSQLSTTRLINPGEVFGGLTGNATCVSYDTNSRSTTRIDL